MARNDSPDSEFDPGMERILREHFDSEASDLDSPSDPWQWLESRLDEPEAPSFLSRLMGSLAPLTQVRISPAFAGAGVAVVAVAVGVAVWAVSGDGGPESSGGIAAIAPTEAPIATAVPSAGESAATIIPSTTAVPQDEPANDEAPERASDRATVLIAMAEPTLLPVPTQAQASRPTVPPTEVAMMEAEVEQEVEVKAADEAMSAPSAPMATAAPYPTTAPAAAMASVPAPPKAASTSPGPAVHPSRPPRPVPTITAGGRTPPATTFRDYQRQQFVAASEDNVSTFSLDTDRTSYQLALNWARSGYEVSPDSVRAEEWLNAFNYEYDLPSNSNEFAVEGDLLPHPLDTDKRLARISFQAPELVDDTPLNVTLVLDASGSMADGNRDAIARQAAESIRQSLRPIDRIAVVHFTNYILDQYTVEHTGPNDNNVQRSISLLRPHGSTNVQAGLNLGVQLAAEVRDRRPNAYNYVILMSDGVANVDATDPFAILETAYDPDSSNPLRLITIGVGINNYNDPLLEQLAQHGNGWYRYLDSSAQAQATFTRENWLALSIPFADQTRAQVTWNAAMVDQWRIIGYENRVTAAENFTQDRKEFAEIYSGAATTVLYELELSESAHSLSNVRLGTVNLRWVDPGTGDSRSQSTTLSGNPSAGFSGRDGALAEFGAIVALTADMYGVLTGTVDEVSADVHGGLSSLQMELRELGSDLGTLDSYNDFVFLLDHMTADLEEKLPPSGRSGYSR